MIFSIRLSQHPSRSNASSPFPNTMYCGLVSQADTQLNAFLATLYGSTFATGFQASPSLYRSRQDLGRRQNRRSSNQYTCVEDTLAGAFSSYSIHAAVPGSGRILKYK